MNVRKGNFVTNGFVSGKVVSVSGEFVTFEAEAGMNVRTNRDNITRLSAAEAAAFVVEVPVVVVEAPSVDLEAVQELTKLEAYLAAAVAPVKTISKRAQARQIVKDFAGESRKQLIARIVELGVKPQSAGVYYHVLSKQVA